MNSLSNVETKKTFDQNHLDYNSRVNLGSYYTSDEYVNIVWSMIDSYITTSSIILDSSCGYGNFFIKSKGKRLIGNDIDSSAIKSALSLKPHIEFYNHNALFDVSRGKFNIPTQEQLVIIGNPPYNDKTSIIRSKTKKQLHIIDDDLNCRDLGISFLKSYKKLNADFVCVLHPLSYLIKEANFLLLTKFASSYRLVDNLIISSQVFTQSSKHMHFPIVIALYKKSNQGMNYSDICDTKFKTVSGQKFCVNDFDVIKNYIRKYPIKNYTPKDNDIFFYTMRDLNALKRNQTFIDKYQSNAIVIDKKKLDYYIYVDVIKDFSRCFPYYFGNFEVVINNDLFLKYKSYFISYACNKHQFCNIHYQNPKPVNNFKQKINEYLQILLKNHYVNSH